MPSLATHLKLVAVCLATLLAACGHTPGRSDGAPGRRLDPNEIKDATPRRDPITRAGNKSPYTVLGQTYVLLPSAKGYRTTGIASWYGTKFHGQSTANGERYDLYEMTAAHKTLPIPSYVLVTNLENNRQAIVRVNDRGPFVGNRVIDLSYAAATKLGYADKGTAFVEVAAIDVDNWPPRTTPDMQPTPRPVAPPLLPPSASVSGESSAASTGYFVQAGAFSAREAAEKLRARLAEMLPQPVVVQPTANAPVLYRVRIGPFAARTQAEQVRSDVLDKQLTESASVVDVDLR